MYQAIETKWFGPTNVKGSRIIAKAEAGRIVVPWEHALNVDQNHARAADLLAEKLGWVGPHYSPLIGGAVAGSGYVFVFANTESVDWRTRMAEAYPQRAA